MGSQDIQKQVRELTSGPAFFFVAEHFKTLAFQSCIYLFPAFIFPALCNSQKVALLHRNY